MWSEGGQVSRACLDNFFTSSEVVYDTMRIFSSSIRLPTAAYMESWWWLVNIVSFWNLKRSAATIQPCLAQNCDARTCDFYVSLYYEKNYYENLKDGNS